MNNKKRVSSYSPNGDKVFYVGIDNEFMALAKEMAKASNEKQQPVGAVIVQGGQITHSDCNNNPLTNLFFINLHKKYCIRHMLKLPTGKYYWVCPGCARKKNHAEFKATEKLFKEGILNKPVDLYLWGHWACCDACCSNMEKVPIDNLFLLECSEKLFNPKITGNIIGKQF